MLTGKQQRFVAEYLKDLNGKQAAIRAGYKASRAEVTASELLAKGKVSEAVSAGKANQLRTADLSAARVLEELRRLAFSDIRQFFDEHGNLRPVHTLTEEQAACIGGLEVIIKNAEAGDGKTDKVHKIKIWDKTRTLDVLAKHFKLLTDKVEHSISNELMDRLDRGRQRAARKP